MWTTVIVIIVLTAPVLPRNIYSGGIEHLFSFLGGAQSHLRLKLNTNVNTESTEHLEGLVNHNDNYPSNQEFPFSEKLNPTDRTGSTDHLEGSDNYFNEYPNNAHSQEQLGLDENRQTESTKDLRGVDDVVNEYSRNTESPNIPDAADTEEFGSIKRSGGSDNYVEEHLNNLESSVTSQGSGTEQIGLTVPKEELKGDAKEQTELTGRLGESDYDAEGYPITAELSESPEATDTGDTVTTEYFRGTENDNEEHSGATVPEGELKEDANEQTELTERFGESDFDAQGYPIATDLSEVPEATDTDETVTTEYSRGFENDNEGYFGNTVPEGELKEDVNEQTELTERFGESDYDSEGYPIVAESADVPEAIDIGVTESTDRSDGSESDVEEDANIPASEEKLEEVTDEPTDSELTERFGKLDSEVKDYPIVSNSSKVPEAIEIVINATDEYQNNVGAESTTIAPEENTEENTIAPTVPIESSESNYNGTGYPNDIESVQVPEAIDTGETEPTEESQEQKNDSEGYSSNTESSNAPEMNVNKEIESTERSEGTSNHLDVYPSTTTENPPDLINGQLNLIGTSHDKTDLSCNDGRASNTHQPHCPIGQLTDEQIALVCPTGFRRHPKYCNLFYQCTSNKGFEYDVIIFNCPENTAFDDYEIQCLPLDRLTVPCANPKLYDPYGDDHLKPISVTDTPLCPGVGIYPHQHQLCSSSFYKCRLRDDGFIEGYFYHCPPDHIYWSVSRHCEELRYFPVCENKWNLFN